MGEMADYFLDRMCDSEIRDKTELDYILEFETKELKSMIKEAGFYKSSYTKMVKEIIKVKKELTDKQKMSLALYYINNPER